MGLPNIMKYQVTKHFVERYRSRLDSNAGEVQALKAFRRIAMNAVFKNNGAAGAQHWYNASENIILVIDPIAHNAITLYKADDQPVEMDFKDEFLKSLNPKVALMIQEQSEKMFFDEIRNSAKALAPIYEDLANLSERMSVTLNRRPLKEQYEEFSALKTAAEQLNNNMEGILKDLENLMEGEEDE